MEEWTMNCKNSAQNALNVAIFRLKIFWGGGDMMPYNMEIVSLRVTLYSLYTASFLEKDDFLQVTKNSVDDMWEKFKLIMHDGIKQFIPTTRYNGKIENVKKIPTFFT